ncbi:hypothetical protein [Microbacterium sp. NIBRBAC000506063]|uniref:hypothetical protein n=1 Tax=Microbacterium sp. NIBRBAC000506063 TaxID=2734618 RepID=UPI001BB69DDB|nr:hypothetical protein [Microbacterium sp. NIBRBAC000506063]QTV79600.1 hypothetical protein KAE78_12255 [Microbacterium sp. NIBRBAC000506063]
MSHGVNAITWTFDPLVARNAHFNLHKLGGRPEAYYTNYYGSMGDELNGADETDRLLIRWQLDSAHVQRACDAAPGSRKIASTALPPPVLIVGERGEPVLTSVVSESVLVSVPSDIEGIRQRDEPLAREWRIAVRDVLGASSAKALLWKALTGVLRRTS